MRFARVALACTLALAACDGATGEDPTGLTITSPAPGAMFARTSLDSLGSLVASVPVEVAVEGMPARVAITLDTTALADLDADGHATVALGASGPAVLTATWLDAEDTPVATASVDIVITDPAAATCKDWLDLYKVTYTAGPASPGVMDPVTVTMPINGMPFRSGGAARTKMFGDCSIIKALAKAAPMLRAKMIVEVTDLGVYNYRCIGSVGTPPNCPNGISQHAYGNAIDLASFKDVAGMTYVVNTDFVIDPAPEKTCTAATVAGKDRFLHELICELKAAKVFNIVLTPNYNADHRDHFHVDMTPGSDFIH
ncbi:MAG: extensin family protein [Polyangiales bacterium]